MNPTVFATPAGVTWLIEGTDESSVWLTEEMSGEPFRFLGLDARTGSIHTRVPLAGRRSYATRFLPLMGRDAVVVADGREARLVRKGAAEASAVIGAEPIAVDDLAMMALVTDRETSGSILVLHDRDLRLLTRLRLRGYTPSFGSAGAFAGDVFYLRTSERIACVPAVQARVRWQIEAPGDPWSWQVFSAGDRPFVAFTRETRDGPVAVVAAIAPEDGALTEVLTLPGELRAASNGGAFLVAQLEAADGSHTVIAWRPDTAAPDVTLPLADGGWTSCCHVREETGVSVHRGALDVFALRDGRIRCVRIGQPDHWTATAAALPDRVFCQTDHLVAIEVAALPFEEAPRAIALDATMPDGTKLAVPAPGLRPAPAPPREAKDLQVLREAAERFGFRIPALLEKLLVLDASEPVASRWIRRTGLELGVSGFSNCWIGTDPAMLGFAGDGSGQQWGLYLYPPQLNASPEPAVVYWDHETRELSWSGATFEQFLRRHLAVHANDDRTDALPLLLAALGLPRDFPEDSWEPAPAWYAAAHGERDRVTLADARAALDRDAIEGERLLVAYVRDHENDDEGIHEMELLYERLGWRFHRENLRQLKHDARR